MSSLPTETAEKKDTEKTLPGGKKIINGIVYDADGKPCRTCNDMSALFALGGKKKRAALPPALPKDCPPDVAQLGRSSWTLLHSITATYPENPPSSLQTETSAFLRTFGKLYPCWVCAEDFQDWMKVNTPRIGGTAPAVFETTSRETSWTSKLWICEIKVPFEHYAGFTNKAFLIIESRSQGSLHRKHGHHASSPETPSPAKPSTFSQPLDRVDRGSAIALGIILVLTLSALGWFCSMRLMRRNRMSTGTRTFIQPSTAIERGRSIGERTPRHRIDKLLFIGSPIRPRADSLVGGGPANGWYGSNDDCERGEHLRWHMSSHSYRPSTEAYPNDAPCVLQAPGNHRRSTDHTRSHSPLAQATTRRSLSNGPSIPRRASYPRRRSSAQSIVTYVPSGQGSISQTQYDKQWWNGAASHRGYTVRRSSRLAPILEPQAALQAESFDDARCFYQAS
ncbi:hypothetical protein OPT61_g4495 [Boeremia exigua]|uniref:Uncharacterized protein n=1 Tax=Boeremia exigua TaxID=749465 RepID=A0ACC2IE20_9PLEO|nr:hypothetical protein OPT61_g4495 [Boeremia exigua]